MTWEKLRLGIVGGDEREQEIARLAATEFGHVAVYGIPWPDAGIEGVLRAESPEEALRGADYALFPIPGIAADGSLFAPAAPHPIVPSAALLSELARGAVLILGEADDRLRRAAAETGVSLVAYEDDRELMLLRGPAIVEGALELAIANTDVTIHMANVAVIGYGNIGGLLASSLRSLGADVTVVARSPVQRAAAHASGLRSATFDRLPQLAANFRMIFSTVPATVVGSDVLGSMPSRSLVMDLAAPPGGVDLDLAESLGHRAIWARGLGRRAPVTVGASQWWGVRGRIEAIEANRKERPT